MSIDAGKSERDQNGAQDQIDDFAGFEPAPPQHKLDDKAANLEQEVQSLKTAAARDKFLFYFVIVVQFLIIVGPTLSGWWSAFVIISAIIFLIGLGRYYDFPWIYHPLERWHDLVFRAAEKS